MSRNEIQTGVILDSLLANRLVFESKKEFEEYAGYNLSSNNQLSGMAQKSARELLSRLEADFLDEQGAYREFQSFFLMYERASEFFKVHLEGKAMLKDADCAFKLACSIFFARELTGEKKLDAVLERLYNYENGCMRRPYYDVVMVIAMILGVLPPNRKRASKDNPDYMEEGRMVLEFVRRIIALNDQYEENPVVSDIELALLDETVPKTRILFLEWISRTLNHIDEITHPEGIDEVMRYLPIEGYWQNWNEKGRTDKNVYYLIEFKGMTYNFMEFSINGTQVLKTLFHAELFQDGEDLVFYLLHPKGGYENLKGKPVSKNNHVWLNCTPGSEAEIQHELSFTYRSGAANFSVRLDTLRKVDEPTEKWLDEILETREVTDKYEKYSCVYAGSVYAVTKTDIYLEDPDNEGCYYKVPRDIDERLYDITVDSMAGMIRVGLEDRYWIGFEPSMLRINPDDFQMLGIEHVDFIV